MDLSHVLALPHLLSAEALGEVQGRAEGKLGLLGTALGDPLALFSTSPVGTFQESCVSCSGQVYSLPEEELGSNTEN